MDYKNFPISKLKIGWGRWNSSFLEQDLDRRNFGEIDQFLGEEKSAGLDGGENAHSSIRLSRRLYSCMQSEARIMLEPAAELLRILAVYRRKRRVLGDRKNI